MDLLNTMKVSASGMKVQSDRLRVVSENIANADSTGDTPGAAPYRRKTISFKNRLDREIGAELVEVNKIGTDKSKFIDRYDPTHPAANAEGYVLRPNVNTIIEMMDMREARRGYEANLNVIESSKTMLSQGINIIR
ncbi:MAG: flagellar basal body rod protein FlgC [Alphaproteobacteria bacterium]|jgi:flagellar basal-body rod protein FlgC|nr:flagellar basal body rod protein FlgC [Rickettsiales bacterium]